MTTRSYSDLSDSATTFDPEEQFDRDIDERIATMGSKLEDSFSDVLARLDDVNDSVRSYNSSQIIVGFGLAALTVVCVLWVSMKG